MYGQLCCNCNCCFEAVCWWWCSHVWAGMLSTLHKPVYSNTSFFTPATQRSEGCEAQPSSRGFYINKIQLSIDVYVRGILREEAFPRNAYHETKTERRFEHSASGETRSSSESPVS
jgi:hypothetical protein